MSMSLILEYILNILISKDAPKSVSRLSKMEHMLITMAMVPTWPVQSQESRTVSPRKRISFLSVFLIPRVMVKPSS